MASKSVSIETETETTQSVVDPLTIEGDVQDGIEILDINDHKSEYQPENTKLKIHLNKTLGMASTSVSVESETETTQSVVDHMTIDGDDQDGMKELEVNDHKDSNQPEEKSDMEMEILNDTGIGEKIKIVGEFLT